MIWRFNSRTEIQFAKLNQIGSTIGPKGFILVGPNNVKFKIESTIKPKGFILKD